MQLLKFDTNPPITTEHEITCHNVTFGQKYSEPFTIGSIGAAIEHCRSYICYVPAERRHAAAIITDEDGVLKVHNRKGEPCYGFLRKYKDRSDRPNDPRPGDLPRDFPNGTPVVLGIPMHEQGIHWEENKDFLSFLYGDKSPYAKLFKDTEVIVVKDIVQGFVFKDLEFDSNLLAYFLKFSRGHYSTWCSSFKKAKETGFFASDEECGVYVLCGGGPGQVNMDYILDLSYFVKGNVRFPTGTFKSGADYARPLIERMFIRDEKSPKYSKRKEYKAYIGELGTMKLTAESVKNVWRKEYEAALS